VLARLPFVLVALRGTLGKLHGKIIYFIL